MALGFLLPLLFVCLTADLLRRHVSPALGRRELLLVTAIILGCSVVIATELLNLFGALTTLSTLLFWLVSCLVVFRWRSLAPGNPAPAFFREGLSLGREMDWLSRVMLAATLLFGGVLGLIALVATPNNYDSMTYHLARVGHWAQDHTISFYGTNIPRQNYMPPWAEWTMLQLTLLQGSDGLVNLVQWGCYVGCLAAASLITELLGGSRRDSILAALFVATLPAATFEATSTQNDLVMSFWLLCLLYGGLKMIREPGPVGCAIFGASLGLAFLTKTVTLIFAAPFCLWFGWIILRQNPAQAWPRLALIAVLTLGLNAGHSARNWATSGNLLGPPEHDTVGSHYLNDIHTPGAVFSNLLRNASLHANLFHNKSLAEQFVVGVHHALGLDPNDPRTTFNGGTYSIWEGGEDGAPMPLHLVLITVGFLALVLDRKRQSPMPLVLAACVLTGAFLFCFFLKWQPFHARLHLALFVLAAPMAVLGLGHLIGRGLTAIIAVLLFLTALPNVFLYGPRPAVGTYSVFLTSSPFQQLFRQPQLAEPYLRAIQILGDHHVRDVGLIWKEDDWEYPLQVTQRVPVPWRLDHVLIDNAYRSLETTRIPDALLCTRPDLGPVLTVHGQTYALLGAFVSGPNRDLTLSIYLPTNKFPQTPP